MERTRVHDDTAGPGLILPPGIQLHEPLTFYWSSHCLTGVSVTRSHEHPDKLGKKEGGKKRKNKEEEHV